MAVYITKISLAHSKRCSEKGQILIIYWSTNLLFMEYQFII